MNKIGCRCYICDHFNEVGGHIREFPLPDMCNECYSAISSALIYEPEENVFKEGVINEIDSKTGKQVSDNSERIRLLSSREEGTAVLEIKEEQSSLGNTRTVLDA